MACLDIRRKSAEDVTSVSPRLYLVDTEEPPFVVCF
jgi:hypothetical protein